MREGTILVILSLLLALITSLKITVKNLEVKIEGLGDTIHLVAPAQEVEND